MRSLHALGKVSLRISGSTLGKMQEWVEWYQNLCGLDKIHLHRLC
jgi:4-hydroxyphenylpyruvate dioxygenase-like putative hemolysin